MLARAFAGPGENWMLKDLGCGECNLANTDYGVDGGVTFADNIPDNLNANVVVDGAQALAHAPGDLPACDIYVAGCHKWQFRPGERPRFNPSSYGS